MRRPALVGLAVANLAVVAWFLLSFRRGGVSGYVYRIDLDVYRIGATVWRHRGQLYGQLPAPRYGRHHLPFTYPPIAAIVFVPFALIPFGLASATITVLTIAALALVLAVTLRSLDVPPHRHLVWALLPATLLLEPVRSTLHYGQINVLLMALVVLDCLTRTPRWPRGVLLGLAAAIKLTPAAFVLFFLIRGDRRAALTAALSFLCVTGVGFLLAWRDSVRYWTATAFDTRRIGGITFASDQSIKALLVRLGLGPGALWLVLAVALVGMAAIGMRRAFAARRPTWALGLNAFGALPASPISWSHHWVWAAPILLTAGVDAWRTRARAAIAGAAGGTLLFILSPHWWWHSTDPWTTWRLLTGDAYLFAAVAVVAHAAVRPSGPVHVAATTSKLTRSGQHRQPGARGGHWRR
ncbi:MAG TPA: glycosyltransferase 87 family protein [Actinophytocola sp.]|uniref:glycosyltransferase 87 family protein n=1 Tax=Actinophytocola sp. TaxID=1872138 RepID=UPI002F922EC5